MTTTIDTTNIIHCTFLREEEDNVFVLATDGTEYTVKNSSLDLDNFPCTINGKDENGEPVLFIVSADNDPLCDEMNCQEVTARWNDINTRLLLAWFPDLKTKVLNREIASKRRMWDEMARRFQESGVEVTAQQAENRWKTLERKYRLALKYPKSSKPFAYFSEYHAVMQQFANLKQKKKKVKVGKRRKGAISEAEFGFSSDASNSELPRSAAKRARKNSSPYDTSTVAEKKAVGHNVARELSLLRQVFEQRQIQKSAWEEVKERNRNKRHAEGIAVFKAILETVMDDEPILADA